MTPLLDGVRIVEIGHALTEHAGRLFAALGAEVLLIEPPGGAPIRHRGPHLDDDRGPRSSIPFLARNTNKHSVVLDPESAPARDRLQALIRRSDLVLDADGSPFVDTVADAGGTASTIRVTDELGLGTAPIVGFAASGAMACSGWPDRAPVNAPSWFACDAASIYAATLGAVALFVANRHGVRLDYEVPYHEGALRCATPWSRHLHSAGINVAGQGVNPGRLGDGPYPVLPSADGHVKIAIATPRQFDALVALCGSPEELTTGPFAEHRFRVENLDAFFVIAAGYLADRTTDELFHEGQRLKLTITPLYRLREFRADPHAESRALFVEVDDPDHGPLELVRAPIVTAEPTDVVATSPAPSLDSGAGRLETALAEPARTLTATDDPIDPLRPLADLRLLQLGSGAVVPEACSDFALLGADVIRVESLAYPDFLRRGGFDGDLDRSPTYNQLNLGVRSLAIDMRRTEATRIVDDLVLRCDAVVENMRAPVVQDWGFDLDRCRHLRHDVVHLSSQGFGPGPYGGYQSYGPNLSAYSGVASQWAHPDDPVPVGTTVPHPDHVAGKQAYIALLAALRRRDIDGRGCGIEAAQVEAPVHLIADRFLAQSRRSDDLPPLGNRSNDMAPHGCFPCLDDEWIAVATETEAQWQALASLVDPALVDDPHYVTNAARMREVDALEAVLGSWTSNRTVAAVEAELRSAGVPCSRVVDADHLAAGPGNEPGGLFEPVDHPAAGRLAVTGFPGRTPDGRRPTPLRAPLLGEHTDAIVAELAACTPENIVDLREEQVIGW